ncbi:DUF1471 domain-containing protein [Klebsiella sp. I138]|uniref:DUF1471 domain-containing protein n=1 Tax=Klebsiella sp. I138 TaxID=2755385 RepID=UPI003DA7B80E
MKRNLLLLTTIALAAVSFIVQAEISPPPSVVESGPLRPAGTVSASGASNLDDLQAKLAEKAHEKGAIAWRINSAGGANKMSGTAIIYK